MITPHLPSALIAGLSDPQVLTLTLYGEARGEAIEGQIAVGCVIRNRVQSGRWGSSYTHVCLAPWQFSCWRPEGGKANHETVLKATAAMAKGQLPDDPLLKQCAWIAQGIITHWLIDTVKAATHYYAPAAMVPKGAVPKWAAGHVPVAKIAGHLFFAGVA